MRFEFIVFNMKENANKVKKKEKFPERMELWKEGLNDREIAKELEVTRSEIFKWRMDNCLKSNKEEEEKDIKETIEGWRRRKEI